MQIKPTNVMILNINTHTIYIYIYIGVEEWRERLKYGFIPLYIYIFRDCNIFECEEKAQFSLFVSYTISIVVEPSDYNLTKNNT